MTELQKEIIRLIQINGVMSRKTLGEVLKVTPAAMSQNTKYLLDCGILSTYDEMRTQRAGRKEILLMLNKNAFFSYGIEVDEPICLVKANALGICESPIFYESYTELLDFLKNEDLTSCVGVALSKRGYYEFDVLSDDLKSFYNDLKNLHSNVTINNNVACQAYSYKYFNTKDENFILIKYGPSLDAACFIGDRLLQSNIYPNFNLERLLINIDGEVIEDKISYRALAADGNTIIEKVNADEELRSMLCSYLAFAIKNANILLQLDKVVISGELFEEYSMFSELRNILFDKYSYDLRRISLVENYYKFNINKSAVTALYLFLHS